MKKRTSKITNEQVKSIFEQMEQGVSLRKACEKEGIKNNTFLNFIEKDKDLTEQYARSRQKGQDADLPGQRVRLSQGAIHRDERALPELPQEDGTARRRRQKDVLLRVRLP